MNTVHILVALHIPKKHADFIIFATHIVESITANPYFPTPAPALPTVSAHIQALQSAETTAKSRSLGTTGARNLALQQVVTDIHQLGAYVQTVADSRPSQAGAVITSAGFAVRRGGVHVKADLSARMSPGGVVTLRAKAAGKRVAYEWQVSPDGGKTWTALPSTSRADTIVPGLSTGTTYLFRVRPNIGRRTGDWYEQATLLVH